MIIPGVAFIHSFEEHVVVMFCCNGEKRHRHLTLFYHKYFHVIHHVSSHLFSNMHGKVLQLQLYLNCSYVTLPLLPTFNKYCLLFC